MTDFTKLPDAGPSHVASDDDAVAVANAVIHSPTVRRVVNYVLGVALLLTTIAIAVDAVFPDVSWGFITGPVMAVIAAVGGVFTIGVTIPNIPK